MEKDFHEQKLRKFIFRLKVIVIYYNRKLTEACHTNARSKKRTGIIGRMSTIGSKGAYASGSFVRKKIIKRTKIKSCFIILTFKVVKVMNPNEYMLS